MFTLEIHFKTGDSFESYEETDKIGHVWESLDKAEEALYAIKDHHNYIQEVKRAERLNRTEAKKLKKQAEKESWFCTGDSTENECYLKVKDDEGNLVKINAFWHGYFETLLSARIVLEEEIMFDFY
jgi:hypothetical protein